MAGKITFTMVKPGINNQEHLGEIISTISNAGFRVMALKYIKLRHHEAAVFYKMHRGRPFYESLIEYMCSGPILAMILEKDNAVEDYRKLMGATDPTKAEEGTLRKLFAETIQRNAVHGSDSDENAEREASFFFSLRERFSADGYTVMD